MIAIDIPGYKKIELAHLVLDYNGTLAIDGKLIDGVKQLIGQIGSKLNIYVLTADTFGSAKGQLSGLNCSIEILGLSMQDIQKEKYTISLGAENVVAIGNGANDALMLKSSALSIAVIQKEGASAKSIMAADIVCFSIVDALELLLNPKRIIATLRR
ncbi:MAG TPA: HAD hydrolase family protein [Bacteroidales bacterium]|nr:HAD hydrolase family protein [Bacteroidales bacterium]